MNLSLLHHASLPPRDELETFRDIFENASIGIFQSTPQGRYVRVNPALAVMYGYFNVRSLMEAMTDIRHQLYVDPGRREEFVETLLSNGSVENFESEVYRRDGSTIWISESSRIVYDEEGNILYFEGFVKNVTQRVKLERQVAEFTQTLEQRVQKRTRELLLEIERRRLAEVSLKNALQEAEAATEAKSRFLASMSHELRTPLNAVIGFADAMVAEISGPIEPPQYAEYVDIIKSSGTLLLDLINDILDLSKINAGAVELNCDIVDVSALILDCLDLTSHRAMEAGVVLEPINDGKIDTTIQADPRRLKQIILNLLTNAIKYTPAGGRVTSQVNVGDKGCLCIRITDTGVGIAPENIDKVLSEYGQAEHGLDHVVEGTGLGLPITKKLVELHGGKLTIESVLGEGTTVTVCLPPEGTK
ncbi:MAG: ATP-binding protein [Rhodospirillales bacterium]|nr:ATP-binding protein [Rhodospirillales bacterium]